MMMSGSPDYVHKKFAPLLDKSLLNALAHRIGKEFPKMGGSRIRHICAEMVLEVVNNHLRPAEYVKHGQMLWLAVSVDDPPARGKTIADTDLVPVVLDIHIDEDVHCRLKRDTPQKRLENKVVRLCQQAYEQGALLSNCDLAAILNEEEARVSQTLTAFQKRTGSVVPRRATIHDVGTGMTHKAIICRKRFCDGLSSEEIARETHHSIEAVDRYLGQYDRVLNCRNLGLSPEKTAYTLKCSLTLVAQYLAIADEIDDLLAKPQGAKS